MINNKALSAYIIEFTSYNKIDVDLVDKYENTDNNTENDHNENTDYDAEKEKIIKPIKLKFKDLVDEEDIKINV